jgi:MFS family permease
LPEVTAAAGAERRRLFDRDFSLWYAGRAVSVFGTAASAVALPLLTYRTSGSAALTAAVVGLEALPYLLFGLLTGAAADRLRRRSMMITADLFCAAALVTVPAAAALGVLSAWHVLAVAFAVGCGFCWFDAAAWGSFAFNAAAGGALGLLVVHAHDALGVSDGRLGLLYAAGAVGSLAGAVALPWLTRRAGQGAVSIAAYAVFALSTVALAGASGFVVALALWAVSATARLVVNANSVTVRQLLTPDELQGRVNTTGRMISWGGTPFGALLGGLTAQAYGVRAAYLLLAVPAVLALGRLLASPVRGLRLAAEEHL